MLYCPGSLASLAERYGLELTKGTFPHNFNVPSNYEYIGEVPPDGEYVAEYENEEYAAQKIETLNSLRKMNYSWNFKHEIHRYCLADTLILCKAMVAFLKEWFDIQSIITSFLASPKPSDGYLPYLHPLSPPFITFSSKYLQLYVAAGHTYA